MVSFTYRVVVVCLHNWLKMNRFVSQCKPIETVFSLFWRKKNNIFDLSLQTSHKTGLHGVSAEENGRHQGGRRRRRGKDFTKPRFYTQLTGLQCWRWDRNRWNHSHIFETHVYDGLLRAVVDKSKIFLEGFSTQKNSNIEINFRFILWCLKVENLRAQIQKCPWLRA